MNPLLTLEHVGFAYHQAEGETPALSDISFTLEAGHFLAIVGPSGCGKSTLLSLISGLLLPEEGRILLHGLPVREARANIGYMLQRDHLFEWRTVYTNVLLGLEISIRKRPKSFKKSITCWTPTACPVFGTPALPNSPAVCGKERR